MHTTCYQQANSDYTLCGLNIHETHATFTASRHLVTCSKCTEAIHVAKSVQEAAMLRDLASKVKAAQEMTPDLREAQEQIVLAVLRSIDTTRRN